MTLKYVEIVVEALDGFRTSVCSTECFVTKLKENLQRKPLVCESYHEKK